MLLEDSFQALNVLILYQLGLYENVERLGGAHVESIDSITHLLVFHALLGLHSKQNVLPGSVQVCFLNVKWLAKISLLFAGIVAVWIDKEIPVLILCLVSGRAAADSLDAWEAFS